MNTNLGKYSMQVYNDKHGSSNGTAVRFSSCLANQIQCQNGKCLPMTDRCNVLINCIEEQDDEKGCDILKNQKNDLILVAQKLQVLNNSYSSIKSIHS